MIGDVEPQTAAPAAQSGPPPLPATEPKTYNFNDLGLEGAPRIERMGEMTRADVEALAGLYEAENAGATGERARLLETWIGQLRAVLE